MPASINGARDLARLQAEHYGSSSGHRADVGNLAIGRNEVARLDHGAEFLGRFFQVVGRLSSVRKLLCLLREQHPGTLILEFFFHARTNFLKAGSSRRLHAQQFINGIALRKPCHVWRRLLARTENGVHKLRRRANPWQAGIAREEVSRDYLQPPSRCRFVQTVSTCLVH